MSGAGSIPSNERTCPKCQTPLEPYAEVDIGVGIMQGGPWGCPACHWVEEAQAMLPPVCGARMGNAECVEPEGHEGPHMFEEDFL